MKHSSPRRWCDTYSGFRTCRDQLRTKLPGLTAAAIARTIGRDPAWYARIETGQAAPSTENFALVASLYLGLFSLLFPHERHSLHRFIREIPAPSSLPNMAATTCPAGRLYCWRLEEIQQRLTGQSGAPVSLESIAKGANLHVEVLPEIVQGGQGSIQTLIDLYHYLRPLLGRSLLLDEILTIPEMPHDQVLRILEETRGRLPTG